MNIAALKQLSETLTEMTTAISDTVNTIEEKDKLRHKDYSAIRQSAQEIKKIAQELRVEVLAQFKSEKDKK